MIERDAPIQANDTNEQAPIDQRLMIVGCGTIALMVATTMIGSAIYLDYVTHETTKPDPLLPTPSPHLGQLNSIPSFNLNEIAYLRSQGLIS